ncbi:unnamed protein product [Periconia digitata]|uniref:Uncharacterized protein n=1 Tax=Periconia digitata TaxID=1303443 RepID=A0A9W4XHF5_9PLEO|nr:unnamed protein product [Periconia digitata]
MPPSWLHPIDPVRASHEVLEKIFQKDHHMLLSCSMTLITSDSVLGFKFACSVRPIHFLIYTHPRT